MFFILLINFLKEPEKIHRVLSPRNLNLLTILLNNVRRMFSPEKQMKKNVEEHGRVSMGASQLRKLH